MMNTLPTAERGESRLRPATPGTAAAAGQVEFRNVTKVYDGTCAVDNVSLTINPGEFVSLLGPSGSGKSTLLMLLAGFTEPSSGSILVDGRNLDRVPPHRRNQGIVFQSYALFPHLTVRENVAFPLKARGIGGAQAVQQVDVALERVRMSAFGHRYPAQLSGGQQQRVALARATVFDPPLILMDESLSALDRKLREEMRVEIKDLHLELGKTIIYVTHDQQEALTMSDRVVVLRGGAIAQVGRPLDIYETPCDPYVAGFVGEANFIEATVMPGGDGAVHLAARSTRMQVASDLQCQAGEQVIAMVRPEAIRLMPPDGTPTDGTTISMPGVVTQVAFLGDAHQYHVAANDQVIVAKAPRSHQRELFERGAQVALVFRSDDVQLFNAGASRHN